MQLDGIHHITAITADAHRNVDFYARVLGLRLVKKSVNQDDPTVYHLFYGDEHAHPGLDLTFFEYPGAALGRAGEGMIHRVVWRVGSEDALDFWAARLAGEGIERRRDGAGLRFADPEGLEHELLVPEVDDEALTAEHPEIPAELALQGFDGVRAYALARKGEEVKLKVKKVTVYEFEVLKVEGSTLQFRIRSSAGTISRCQPVMRATMSRTDHVPSQTSVICSSLRPWIASWKALYSRAAWFSRSCFVTGNVLRYGRSRLIPMRGFGGP